MSPPPLFPPPLFPPPVSPPPVSPPPSVSPPDDVGEPPPPQASRIKADPPIKVKVDAFLIKSLRDGSAAVSYTHLTLPTKA